MHIVIAPGRLKDGVTEQAMLAASERFQTEFVVHQPGVVRRTLVTDQTGGYADIIHFTDEAAIGQVMEAELANDACQSFMALWEGAQPAVYRILRIYE